MIDTQKSGECPSGGKFQDALITKPSGASSRRASRNPFRRPFDAFIVRAVKNMGVTRRRDDGKRDQNGLLVASGDRNAESIDGGKRGLHNRWNSDGAGDRIGEERPIEAESATALQNEDEHEFATCDSPELAIPNRMPAGSERLRALLDPIFTTDRELQTVIDSLSDGRPLSHSQLLRLQSKTYSHMQRVDLLTKSVDRLAQGLRQITSMQT